MESIRGGEYWHSTHGIDYTLRHYEYPFATLGPCACFFTFTIGDVGSTLHSIPCRLISKEEHYYQIHRRQFKARLRSHYPHISRGCAADVTESFMDIVHIANATHACTECQPGISFSAMHVVYVEIQPHHHAAAERRALRPATRASVVELLMKASSTTTTTTTAEDEEECAICMEEMQLSKTLITMPCSHSFHQTCLLPWLDDNHSCPLCRYQLPRAEYRSLY